MKIWKLEAFIETEDNISREDIIDQIDLSLNNGDGLYFETEEGFSLKLYKIEKED